MDKNNFHFIKEDLLNGDNLKKIFSRKIDTIFHLAANSDISRSAKDPIIDLNNTTMATFNVLEAMRANEIKKIFYFSGSGVYGDVGNLYTNEDFGPLCPVSMYGATKLSAEAMIYAYSSLFDMKVWVLRPANIIGPRATHGVIFDFIGRLRENERKLTVLGNGEQSKSYIYVADVIEAVDLVWNQSKKEINILLINRLTGAAVFNGSRLSPPPFASVTAGLDESEINDLLQECHENLSKAFFDKNGCHNFWRVFEFIIPHLQENLNDDIYQVYEALLSSVKITTYYLTKETILFLISFVKQGIKDEN